MLSVIETGGAYDNEAKAGRLHDSFLALRDLRLILALSAIRRRFGPRRPQWKLSLHGQERHSRRWEEFNLLEIAPT